MACRIDGDLVKAAGRGGRVVKKTRWFNAIDEPPVRVGWYECRNARGDGYTLMRYWSGESWFENGPRSPRVFFGTWNTLNEWRGLAA